jgi:hypothetical protein
VETEPDGRATGYSVDAGHGREGAAFDSDHRMRGERSFSIFHLAFFIDHSGLLGAMTDDKCQMMNGKWFLIANVT